MRIVVTGAAGQLGQAVCRGVAGEADLMAFDRAALDITDRAAVLARLAAVRPDVIINCAAYNDVDGAEDRPGPALEVNAFGVKNLALAAASTGALLVHYSTDFVFDGETSQAYTEDVPPAPHGAYAVSKLLGEWFARDAPRWYVLRVESLFGGPNARSSLDRIVEAIESDREWPAFVDRTVSPSYVADVVTATRALIGRRPSSDVYHCVNSGQATWYEVAEEIGRLLGRRARLRPVRMSDVPLKARRPRFSALSNARLASVGIELPSWQDALGRYLAGRPGSTRQPRRYGRA